MEERTGSARTSRICSRPDIACYKKTISIESCYREGLKMTYVRHDVSQSQCKALVLNC